MKIRIKGNSVRFRLTKTEVDTLCKTGRFEEKTHFPNGVFTYALRAVTTTDQMAADISGSTIEIQISIALIKDWPSNNKVGFQHKVSLENNEELWLLVEKDFVCLDDTVEDQADNYPNPKRR